MKSSKILFFTFAGILTALLLPSFPVSIWAQEENSSKYDGSVSVSLNFTDGNTNSTAQRIAAEVSRTSGKNKFSASGEYNEGSSEGETTIRNQTYDARYQRDLSEKTYALVSFELFKDAFKNLDRRTTTGLGLGYKVINEEKTKLNFEGGVSYIYENFERTSAETYYALRIGDSFSHTFENGTEIYQKGEFIPSVESSDDYLINSTQGVRTKLSKSLSLDTSVKLKYDNETPKDSLGRRIPRSDGRNVSKLDTQYFISLTYSF